MTIIQLVSEQTMQNLLPIMHFKPAEIAQIRTPSPRFERAAENLRAAVKELKNIPEYSNYSPKVHDYTFEDRSPTPLQIAPQLRGLLMDYPKSVLNYTGGTKMIAAGGLGCAFDERKPAIYCDTANKRIVHTWGPNDGNEEEIDISYLADRLTVRLIMAAHGKTSWNSESITPELLRFGKVAYTAKSSHREAFNMFDDKVRRFLRPSRGKVPKSRKDLLKILGNPLPEPDPALREVIRQFLKAAVDAGILQERNQRFFLMGSESENKQRLRKQVERAANLLGGSWFEFYVCDLGMRSNRFADVQVSLEGDVDHDAYGETDVVCVDKDRFSLRVISCKESMGRSLLEHMESLATRCRSLGGSHSRPALAVAFPGSDSQVKNTGNWARALEIDLLIGEEIKTKLG